jgi:hypothetical protein
MIILIPKKWSKIIFQDETDADFFIFCKIDFIWIKTIKVDLKKQF